MPRKSLRADLVAGWAEVRARTWYWTSLIGHATWNFAAGRAVGYLTGAFIAGRTKVSRAILVGNIAIMSYAAPLILFAVAAPAWAVVAAYGLAMACLGFLNAVWETAVQQEIPAEVLARDSAYDWLVSLGAIPLGLVLGPVLAREFGYVWPLMFAAVLVLVTLSISGVPARCPQSPAAPRRSRRKPSPSSFQCPETDKGLDLAPTSAVATRRDSHVQRERMARRPEDHHPRPPGSY